MTDHTTRPGNGDEAIDLATGKVIETWERATEGKDPAATTADFERMRDGFAELASREEQLTRADADAPPSGGEARDIAARTRATDSGPDA